MPDLVFYLLVFLVLGSIFLYAHLGMGHFIRPHRPDPDKLTIYECGEPAVGSAWIQFDLRYYVVALLFVVFDVEVAFFFPWAVVFGTTLDAAHETVPEQRVVLMKRLQSDEIPALPGAQSLDEGVTQATAKSWAWAAFADILVFFGVLMMGFAYLWRRGDIDWVRSMSHAEKTVVRVPGPRVMPPSREIAETAST